jgi:hypothetical protein
MIENNLSFPSFFALSPIRKVDTKDIKNFSIFLEDKVCYSAFIRRWISLESRLERVDVFSYTIFHPYSSTSIARFLSGIIKGFVPFRHSKLLWKFVFSGLDFLQKEEIWVVGFEYFFEFSFIVSRSDPVHVPGDDAHRKI